MNRISSDGTSPLLLRELSQSNIDTIDLGRFAPHKSRIKDVIHLIHKSRQVDYSTRRDALVEFCTHALENGFNARLRGGVIMQIANPAIRNLSSSISSNFVEGITNLFDDTQGQLYSASGDSNESVTAKVGLAVHRLFNKKQNVAEEIVAEEVVEKIVEIKESLVSLNSEGGALRLMQPQMQIAVRQSNTTESSFISPMEPLNRLATDFRSDYMNPAIGYAFAGEFINYAFTNLGIAIQKVPGSGYVIDFVAPVGRAIGSGIDSVKGVGASGIRFVIGEEKFNEILNSFHNSPRGIRFLVNDLVDSSTVVVIGGVAGAVIGGGVGVAAGAVVGTGAVVLNAVNKVRNRVAFKNAVKSTSIETLVKSRVLGVIEGESIIAQHLTDPLNLSRKSTPQFELAARIESQLNDKRLGNLVGKIDKQRLIELAHNLNAQFLYDTRYNTINVIQKVDDVSLRITTLDNQFKIISVGPIRERNIINSLKNGRFLRIGEQKKDLFGLTNNGVKP